MCRRCLYGFCTLAEILGTCRPELYVQGGKKIMDRIDMQKVCRKTPKPIMVSLCPLEWTPYNTKTMNFSAFALFG